MTQEEYLKKLIKLKFRGWKKIFIYLKVSSFQIVPNGKDKWNYRLREFNPYNPLSYIIALPLAILAIFMQGVPETIDQIKKSFKYR